MPVPVGEVSRLDVHEMGKNEGGNVREECTEAGSRLFMGMGDMRRWMPPDRIERPQADEQADMGFGLKMSKRVSL